MKSLYVVSLQPYAGKTAVCLSLGKRLQNEGHAVGYFKPFSIVTRPHGEQRADRDAAFARDVLGLTKQAWELSPVSLSVDRLREHLREDTGIDLEKKVQEAYDACSDGQDFLLLEGGGSLRDGYGVGLPTVKLARNFASHILVVLRYRDQVGLLDDAIMSQDRLGEVFQGVVLNRVPAGVYNFVADLVAPYLEKHGIPVFGIIPDKHNLAALTVGDLVEALDAEILTKYYRSQSMVENLVIGAMTAETALAKLRQFSRKAVITGGDRTDIQLEALETSTTCLVLTGNIHPNPLIIKLAEEFGVAVLMVGGHTMEAVERIEAIHGKTKLHQVGKLKQFQSLMDKNLDFDRLYSAIGIS